jgi:signal transduction histidine kinase
LSLPFTSRDSVLYSLYLALLAARTFIVCALSAGMGWLLDRQREQERALDEANLKLVHHASTIEELAISQERNRLARELHDTLAHSLTATAVQLEAVSAVWEADERAARDMLGQALHTTRAGLSGARRALQALRASPLEEVGLAVAVGNLARSAAARANLTLELDVPPRLDHVPPDIAQCVYRVAEEALANVVRHAKARQLVVALACANDHLSLAIADDGCGFGPADVEPARYGLKGMRERAELIGGLLTVAPTHGGGTTVKLNVGG